MPRSRNSKKIELVNEIIMNQIKSLAESFTNIEKKLEATNSRIDELASTMGRHAKLASEQHTEQLPIFRAKTERFGEPAERRLGVRMASEQPSATNGYASVETGHGSVGNTHADMRDGQLGSVRGRHREILAMLINNGFHTYEQIAQKLGISQSRARAYIADLRNNYGVPLKQVRDPEGYKIGIDVRFVEQILVSK